MAAKQTLKIENLRLAVAAPMGKGSVVMQYFYNGVRIDDATVTCSFDKDPRFIRVEFGGKDYFELVPLTNVTSMRCVFVESGEGK